MDGIINHRNFSKDWGFGFNNLSIYLSIIPYLDENI